MDDLSLKIDDLGKKIAELDKRISNIERDSSVEDMRKIGTKSLSMKEFMLSKKPKDDSQKILVIAYFLETYEGLSSFNVRDLISGFERAKEKMPANINDRVSKIIGNTGYIMEVKQKKDKLKAWLLTNSGEHFVNENLPSE